MATVRGMTPEAIRALLKKEIGDYQALSIAVSNAKGTSESAIREVETIREDLKNMDFDFDTSQFDKAMEELEQNMSELTESLDKVAEESLARETKLTALELALNKDREKFNQEMLDMAKELEESKEALKQELTEATEKLAQNLTEVGTNLSNELEKANKTLSEDLAKDLKKLNTDLSKSFGKDLKNLETRQNSKTESLDRQIRDYKANTDSKMGTLLSEIDKAKAYADGLLQPGNLVWNPMALADARGITISDGDGELESVSPSDRKGGALKVTKTGNDPLMIDYGSSHNSTFELNEGDVLVASAWVRASVKIPKGAIIIGVQGTLGYRNPDDIPANTWTKLVGEISYLETKNRPSYFWFQTMGSLPTNSSVIVSEPHLKKKVTSDLIVDGAVTSKSLATGAVTAGKIAADAVTSNNITAGAVNADKIAANAIGADQLAANAVTADKIAANAVDADKIKAKSIGSDQLAANAVTAEKLAAKAVKAGNIDSNAVTAQHLAANAVTADKIAANSVDTTKLTVMPGNLFPDPRFLDPLWDTNSNRKAGKFFGYENGYQIQAIGKQTGAYYWPSGIPRDTAMRLEPGAAYRLTCRINFIGENPPGGVVVYLRTRNKNTGKKSVFNAGAIERTDANTNVDDGFGVGELNFVFPDFSDDGSCTIGFFLERRDTSGEFVMTDVQVTRAADASLIVKGGIQSDHIAANAITSDHISVGSINGDRIAANTLDAGAIKAGSLTSDNVTIKDGAIKTAMIGDGQITNAKIKDLNAGKINAGTINAAQIGANSITGAKIASNTITSKEIAANTITSKEIAANTITGKELAANTITSDNIRANAIRVNELHADAIIRSGMSLILSEATGPKGELEPIWWKIPGLTKFSDPEVDGEPWYGTTGDRIEASPPSSIKIKILQGIKYRLKFNIKATHPGSILFIEMRDQNGNRAVKSGAVHRGAASYKTYRGPYRYIQQAHDYTNSTEGNYLVSNYLVPTAPTQVVALIEFNPDVTHVYLSRFYFNHSNGRTTEVRISGLTLEADVPNQEEIDAKQDEYAQFTRKITENIARMLSRQSSYVVNTTVLKGGYWGTRPALGFASRTPGYDRILHIYMYPEWTGSMGVTVIYSSGDVKYYGFNHDEFEMHTSRSAKSAPPDSYSNKNKFLYKYQEVPIGNIDTVRYDIQMDASYTEMRDTLFYGTIPTSEPLTYGRKSKPSPDSKEAPPWERKWSSSRRPW